MAIYPAWERLENDNISSVSTQGAVRTGQGALGSENRVLFPAKESCADEWT